MDFDLCVIGGGPAGMIGSGRAGEKGAKVILLERNPGIGAKLLITGKGRCNITNHCDDWRDFIAKFGSNGKFLIKAINKFGINETMNFFQNYGVDLKVEEGNRVFPVSDLALDVLKALIKYMKTNNVAVKTSAVVRKINFKDGKITTVELTTGEKFSAQNYLLAVGGKSYPATGSKGDGYSWLEKMGHTIIKPKPALVPILVKEKFIKSLQGLSLKNVEISLWQGQKLINKKFGEALFTDRGMTGPIILTLSRDVLPGEKYELKIDFKPALNSEQLDQRILNDFKKYNNKQFKNCLDDLLPQRAIPVFLQLLEIDPEKKVNLITKEERKKIIDLLKNFTLNVSGLGGWEEAIITAGGVSLKEVDPNSMRSKIIDNLYFAGEILDLDGPTGGYNLQECWSTGFLAGDSSTE